MSAPADVLRQVAGDVPATCGRKGKSGQSTLRAAPLSADWANFAKIFSAGVT